MIESLVLALLPLVKKIYTDAHAANPYDPQMTDEELHAKALSLLMTDSDRLIANAKAWLDAHPGQ